MEVTGEVVGSDLQAILHESARSQMAFPLTGRVVLKRHRVQHHAWEMGTVDLRLPVPGHGFYYQGLRK